MTTSAKFLVASVVLTLSTTVGCWRSPEETSETMGANTIAPWSKPPLPDNSSVSPAAERAAYSQPSIKENMGRNFQGRMEFRVSVVGQPDRMLRYMGQGNASRLQVERAKDPIDLLFTGGKLHALDHVAKSYRTFELADVPEQTAEAKKPVRLEEQVSNAPVERKMVQGVVCEDWKISEGSVRIEACVAGLPGAFNVDKFESVSGLNVPSWLEQLLRDDNLPVSVVARDGEGKLLYSVQLESYVAGSVDLQTLSLPANYKAAGSGS